MHLRVVVEVCKVKNILNVFICHCLNRLIDDLNTVTFMCNFVVVFCAAVAATVELFTCLTVCVFFLKTQT